MVEIIHIQNYLTNSKDSIPIYKYFWKTLSITISIKY